MEAANGSINSKVIVQFNDPSDLFKDVAPQIQKRLPLSNLHWKSPSRPLRSIEELDVSLNRLQDDEDQASNTSNVRRHQIPGLRQTPFVKVLLVRCDEKDKYKETVRKDTKDWVKSLGLSTSGKSIGKGQERHDAYEYVIVHVVVPGTPAAIQPRSSKHFSVDATDSTDSLNSKSKWTGKSTSTVFDKLKADFASSSKAPFERVAQVRLTDPSKPSNALGPLEIEESWQDLLDKLKVAILQSFDARVAQYEEDIKERDSQRSLPGWNFCTFFILKEGLARGFENVGLLEDALQIYDELDAGLDVIVQDQAKQDQSDAANALLPYAADLKDLIRKALEDRDVSVRPEQLDITLNLQAWSDAESAVSPFRLDRRPYQQMILTNEISALDFRTYIFIRQTQIMLRRAGTSIPLPKSRGITSHSTPRWDADLLSTICTRSVSFINLAARNLRQDLFAAWGGQEGLPADESNVQQLVIDHIVASRKWSCLLQTLFDCQIIASFAVLRSGQSEAATDSELFSPKDFARENLRHIPSQSLSTTTSQDTNGSVNGVIATHADAFAALRVVKGSKSDLIFWAAELLMMLRTILLQLCREANMLPHLTTGTFSTIHVQSSDEHAWTGIDAPSLRSSISQEKTICDAYKLLTVCACQCYTSAGKTRSSRQLLFDLANLEARNDNLEAALVWLDAIPDFLDIPPRSRVEFSMLELYIDCLRRTERQVDLMQSLLLILQSQVTSTKHDQVQKSWTDMSMLAAQIEPLNVPFNQLFSIESIEPYIHQGDSPGKICIALSLRSLVAVSTFGPVSIQVSCQAQGQQSPDSIMFRYDGDITPDNNLAQLNVSSTTMTEGWYHISQLTLQLGNLTFVHDFASLPHGLDHEDEPAQYHETGPSIYLYHSPGTPVVKASHSYPVNLAAKRNLMLSITWGEQNVTNPEMRVRPATAGARLDILGAKSLTADEFQVSRQEDAYRIVFQNVRQGDLSELEIPYSIDEPNAINMTIRVELMYEIADTGKTVRIYNTLSFMTLLPVTVNVQDIFQKSTTISRFTIGPARLAPISVMKCSVDCLGNSSIAQPTLWMQPIDVFPKQPLSWAIKSSRDKEATKSKVQLTVEYRCVDEAILDTITVRFVSDLSKSDFAHLVRPLVAHLRNRTTGSWTEQEIESSTLLAEINFWTFEQLDWSTILHAFKGNERSKLQVWLERWHIEVNRIPLDISIAPKRTLQLLVDLPTAQLVVTAKIHLQRNDLIVGQPILASLEGHFDLRDSSLQPKITIELTSQTDAWLVGGQKRLCIGSGNESFKTTIVLIAEKTGKLLLPGIEVRCLDLKSGKAIECEIDNSTSATTVTVRNDIKTTTIALGDGDATEGHWLVDARRGQDV